MPDVLDAPVSEISAAAPARRSPPAALWAALRPEQWVKNLFVAAPLLFSQHLTVSRDVRATVEAILLFCAISSSVYLFNDLQDVAQDRAHPRKRFRPLAAGELSPGVARAAMAALWLIAAAGSLRVSPAFTGLLLAYWAMNVGYSRWWKHRVIVDVFLVAAGYLLRVLAGAAVINVQVSIWLLICTTLLALFIGFCKRRSELALLAGEAAGHRQVLGEYTAPFLDMMIGIAASATLVSYLLYTASEDAIKQFHWPGPIVTAPFVLYGFFRYLYVVYQKQQGGDPIQLLLADGPMKLTLALWVATSGLLLYWR